MSLRLNDIAPNFTADSTHGVLTLHDWVGQHYAIVFSHPKDFTPVCTTEFAALARLVPEFSKRKTKLMGVSVDDVESHHHWIRDIESMAEALVDFPIIDDSSLRVAKLYDMLPAEEHLPDGRTAAHTATVRTVFIIGPDKRVRLTMAYPMSVGRNFQEILRTLDAIQLTDREFVATPADWVPGRDVVVSLALNDVQATERFGPLDVRFPYLRMAKAPK
jgi:alkyl hydroperoxide reductase subunit AhpC